MPATMQTLTHIMGVRLPSGKTLQVAGTQEDLDLLCVLLAGVPAEVKGRGVIVEIDDDIVFRSSSGKELERIPHGNAVQVPDIRPQMKKLIKETEAQPPRHQ